MRAGAFDARRVAGVRLGFYFAANNVFPAGSESISWDQIFRKLFTFLFFFSPFHFRRQSFEFRFCSGSILFEDGDAFRDYVNIIKRLQEEGR